MSFKLDINLDFIPTYYYTEENQIKFDPALYVQRYCFVAKVLGHKLFKNEIKKVVDFGCAEMKFFNTIRYNLPEIEHVVEIDIDEELLRRNMFVVEPLMVDYYSLRPKPLKVEVYKGSIASKSQCLQQTDAVVAIELIEHLTEDHLKRMPSVVFEFMKPKIAIFTTPNREANVLFPDLQTFRHPDHKFEWTREEFENWANDVCRTYPSYSVMFYQIGAVPPELDVGGVSQAAVFLLKDFVNSLESTVDDVAEKFKASCQTESPEKKEKINEDDFELIFSVDYTYDKRSDSQKIIDDCKFHINQNIKKYTNYDGSLSIIPLNVLFELLSPLCGSTEQLKELLVKEGYKVEEEHVIIDLIEDESLESLNDELLNDEFSPNYEVERTEEEEENWD
ncbi:small RNA 2'-O-methyltransferase [Culicoides brevitarsis]|uniref:small RNA 2'-O-methyltransferase n=1 Tax=Culicoides brevitarsis TaxID=469753 RepID=UPI00307B1B5A